MPTVYSVSTSVMKLSGSFSSILMLPSSKPFSVKLKLSAKFVSRNATSIDPWKVETRVQNSMVPSAVAKLNEVKFSESCTIKNENRTKSNVSNYMKTKYPTYKTALLNGLTPN